MKILRQLRTGFINAFSFLLGLSLASAALAAESSRASKEFLVYFGTYTGAKSKGIYVSRLDTDTGKLTAPELAAESASPSFLAIHPSHKFLYAANEVDTFGGKKSGA